MCVWMCVCVCVCGLLCLVSHADSSLKVCETFWDSISYSLYLVHTLPSQSLPHLSLLSLSLFCSLYMSIWLCLTTETSVEQKDGTVMMEINGDKEWYDRHQTILSHPSVSTFPNSSLSCCILSLKYIVQCSMLLYRQWKKSTSKPVFSCYVHHFCFNPQAKTKTIF